MIESFALVTKETAKSIGDAVVDAGKREVSELPDKIGMLSEVESLPDKVDLVLENDKRSGIYDDNGKQYRTEDGGWIPNNTYVLDEVTYKTDDSSLESYADSADSEDIASEYGEDGTRELTENEKQELKDKLGWSDEKLKKCTIDENGVIHYKTDRSDMEGQTTENGVPYERRRIEINGVVIEGVFPKFESAFDTELAPDNLKTKAYAKECNEALKEAIENDPELRSKFTDEQLQDIEEGRTPRGYVWHHNEEPGKMQLVKREDHDRAIGGAAHTGGNSLWGADSVDNSKKGEIF